MYAAAYLCDNRSHISHSVIRDCCVVWQIIRLFGPVEEITESETVGPTVWCGKVVGAERGPCRRLCRPSEAAPLVPATLSASRP